MHHSDPSTNILTNKFLILFYPVGIWPLAGSFFSFSFFFYLLVICFFCSRVERVWCEALTWVNWNKWNKWNKWLFPLFWATTWKRTPPKPQPDYRLLRPTASLCGRRWNHETLLTRPLQMKCSITLICLFCQPFLISSGPGQVFFFFFFADFFPGFNYGPFGRFSSCWYFFFVLVFRWRVCDWTLLVFYEISVTCSDIFVYCELCFCIVCSHCGR